MNPHQAPNPPDPDDLLTVKEVADKLRVSGMTVYRLIRAGDLPALRVGGKWRIRQGDYRAYLQRGGS